MGLLSAIQCGEGQSWAAGSLSVPSHVPIYSNKESRHQQVTPNQLAPFGSDMPECELSAICQCRESKSDRGPGDLPKSHTHTLPIPEGCQESWASQQSMDLMHPMRPTPTQKWRECLGEESSGPRPCTDVQHQRQAARGLPSPACTQIGRHCLSGALESPIPGIWSQPQTSNL